MCADIPMRAAESKGTLKPSERCSCPPPKCCGGTPRPAEIFQYPCTHSRQVVQDIDVFWIPTSASLNPDVFPTDLHRGREGVSSNQNLQWCLCLSAPHWNSEPKCPCASGVLPGRIMVKEGWGMWGAKRDGQGYWAPVGMSNCYKQCPGLMWDHRKRRLDWRHLRLRSCHRSFLWMIPVGF